MHILLGIGMQMVMPVLGSPPQDAFLRARLRQERQEELKDPAGGVGAMGEIPVITGADREKPHPIEDKADRDGLPADAAPERGEAGEMDQHKRQRRGVHDVGMRVVARAIGASL